MVNRPHLHTCPQQRRAAYALALIAAALLIYFSLPFIEALAMGAILSVVAHPVYKSLRRKSMGRRVSAAATTLAVTIGSLLPIAALFYFGGDKGIEQLRSLTRSLSQPQQFVHNGLAHLHLGRVDALETFIMHTLERTGELLTSLAGIALARIPNLIISTGFMVFTLYFALLEDEKIIKYLRRKSVFSHQRTQALFHMVKETCNSVILVNILAGLSQALVMGSVCLIAGIPNALLVALLVFLASFLPVVGASPITGGLALFELLQGNGSLSLIIIVAAILIVVADNLLRPWLLGGQTQMHPLLAFVSAFGALEMIGFYGIFLGPVICGIALSTFTILFEPDPATEEPELSIEVSPQPALTPKLRSARKALSTTRRGFVFRGL